MRAFNGNVCSQLKKYTLISNFKINLFQFASSFEEIEKKKVYLIAFNSCRSNKNKDKLETSVPELF